MPHAALPGFRDFYPEELAQRSYILGAWREVMRRYAFVEYDGPPLEPLDLYRQKSGDELVGQLYSFMDKGKREVALRPEMTPTFARMVAARANALRKPVRWFSIPQLFRNERQQRGRLREHFQLNADLVGESSEAADAEVLAVALDVMRSLGLTYADVGARVSDRRLLHVLLSHSGVTDDAMTGVYAVIDKRNREPADVAREKLEEAAGSSEVADRVEAVLSCRDVAALIKRYSDVAGVADHIDRMRKYLSHVAALGFGDWVRLDLSIVRGLAYYTGIVFELFDTAGELRAVCGGGRYDTLLARLGGPDLPAVGFGMGDVVLGELLRSRNLVPSLAPRTDFWVASDDESLLEDVMIVASELRRRNRSAEYALRPQQLSRQLKAAASAGARSVVILKRERFAAREVTVKDLDSGAELALPLENFLSTLV